MFFQLACETENMTGGRSHEFTFHVYWHPDTKSFELRQIGNLRPPNELIAKATEIAHNHTDEITLSEISQTNTVHVGTVTLEFVNVPNNPDKNIIKTDSGAFNEKLTVETGTPIGDKVAGEYEQNTPMSSTVTYKPYQDKGWLRLNGLYYSPDDSKPDGWTE